MDFPQLYVYCALGVGLALVLLAFVSAWLLRGCVASKKAAAATASIESATGKAEWNVAAEKTIAEMEEGLATTIRGNPTTTTNNTTSLMDLPNEMLAHIFTHCTIKERQCLVKVNSRLEFVLHSYARRICEEGGVSLPSKQFRDEYPHFPYAPFALSDPLAAEFVHVFDAKRFGGAQIEDVTNFEVPGIYESDPSIFQQSLISLKRVDGRVPINDDSVSLALEAINPRVQVSITGFVPCSPSFASRTLMNVAVDGTTRNFLVPDPIMSDGGVFKAEFTQDYSEWPKYMHFVMFPTMKRVRISVRLIVPNESAE